MNENDLWLLVRSVRVAQYEQTQTILMSGEGAATGRLVKKKLLNRTGPFQVYPTKAGFEFVGSMVDVLRRM